MYVPGAKVRMIRDQIFGTPEGGTLRVQANQWIAVRYIYYPGEPRSSGYERVHASWHFWTDGDIDAAYIFRASDIVELALPDNAPVLPDAIEFLITRQAVPARAH